MAFTEISLSKIAACVYYQGVAIVLFVKGKSMKKMITLFTVAFTMFAFVNANACGDSLYRVGKGVAYRTYTAPLPGNLLVFGTSESAMQLAEELARSGHGVHVVETEEELSVALAEGGYDVVIAPYSERAAVEGTSGTSTSFLPVVMNSDEERQARESYDRVMVPAKHELKHYLKEIHRALKNNA